MVRYRKLPFSCRTVRIELETNRKLPQSPRYLPRAPPRLAEARTLYAPSRQRGRVSTPVRLPLQRRRPRRRVRRLHLRRRLRRQRPALPASSPRPICAPETSCNCSTAQQGLILDRSSELRTPIATTGAAPAARGVPPAPGDHQ